MDANGKEEKRLALANRPKYTSTTPGHQLRLEWHTKTCIGSDHVADT